MRKKSKFFVFAFIFLFSLSSDGKEKKKMSLHRSSDTLSRCDSHTYTNLYDAHKRVEIKTAPLVENKGPKDTIEFSRDQFKKEALSRLRHKTNQTMSHSGFMRVGKYLFMAVAFPPYVLLYGVPKWIFTEGFPALLTLCTWLTQSLYQKLKKPMEKASHGIAKVFEFVHKLSQILLQPLVRLTSEIKQALQRFAQKFSVFFHQWGERLFFKPIRRIKQKSSNGSFKAKFQFFKQKIKQKIEDYQAGLKEWTDKGIEYVKNLPQLALTWSKVKLQRLKGQSVSWGDSWNQRWSRAQNIVGSFFQKMQKGYSRVQESSNVILRPVKQLWKETIQPLLAKFKDRCLTYIKKTGRFLGECHRKGYLFLLEKQKKLKKISGYEWFLEWISKSPHAVRHRFTKLCQVPLFKKVVEKSANFSLAIVRFFLKVLTVLLEVIGKSATKLRDIFDKRKPKVICLFNKARGGTLKGLQFLQKNVIMGCYYFLVGFTMAILLMGWGLQSLNTLLTDMMKSLSLKKFYSETT